MANISESTFKTLISSRYILSYLGFYCTLVIYFCRVNLSIAIVAMTESDYYELNTTDTNKSSTGNADFDWNTLEKTNLLGKIDFTPSVNSTKIYENNFDQKSTLKKLFEPQH